MMLKIHMLHGAQHMFVNVHVWCGLFVSVTQSRVLRFGQKKWPPRTAGGGAAGSSQHHAVFASQAVPPNEHVHAYLST